MGSLLSQGGWMLAFILIIASAATVIFVDRLLRIRKVAIDYQDFLQGVFTVFDKGNVDEAIAICDDSPGPIAAIVSEAILHRDSTPENLRQIVNSMAHAEISRLERRVRQVLLFAQLLPLLGLIGTLIAAYETLGEITAAAPLVDAVRISAPLAKALITTVAGLAASAACYAMHHVLLLRIESLVLDMEAATVLTLDHLTKCREDPGE